MGDSTGKGGGAGGGLAPGANVKNEDLAKDLLDRLPGGLTLRGGQNNKLLNISGWKTGSGQEVPVQIGIGRNSFTISVGGRVSGFNPRSPDFAGRTVTNSQQIPGRLNTIKRRFGKKDVTVSPIQNTALYPRPGKRFGTTK